MTVTRYRNMPTAAHEPTTGRTRQRQRAWSNRNILGYHNRHQGAPGLARTVSSARPQCLAHRYETEPPHTDQNHIDNQARVACMPLLLIERETRAPGRTDRFSEWLRRCDDPILIPTMQITGRYSVTMLWAFIAHRIAFLPLLVDYNIG